MSKDQNEVSEQAMKIPGGELSRRINSNLNVLSKELIGKFEDEQERQLNRSGVRKLGVADTGGK